MLKKSKAKKSTSNKKLIVANWKMNPTSSKEAKKIFATLKRSKQNFKKSQPIICPPLIYLPELTKSYSGRKFLFGTQDFFPVREGEFTGQISWEMVSEFNPEYVIVGHSEIRDLGETEEMISEKVKYALGHKVTPILCIGEKERYENGSHLKFIEEELREGLSKIKKTDLRKVVIAYEPIWAIGKGHNAVTPYELHQMNIFIKKVLAGIFDRKSAMAVKILYGGSVDDENSVKLINEGEVDGLLVGRASLNPYVFLNILKSLEK